MYHLPLLPGYGPNSNIRSSAPSHADAGNAILSRLSEAEENGYQGTYFTGANDDTTHHDGYISSSPVTTRTFSARNTYEPETPSEAEAEATTAVSDAEPEEISSPRITRRQTTASVPEDVAEVVFFEYGVVVFFGLNEGQERGVLDDLENANILMRKISDEDWEVEECHYTVRFLYSFGQLLKIYSACSMTLTYPILESITTFSPSSRVLIFSKYL